MHYSVCADITVMFETHGIGQTPSLLERCLVYTRRSAIADCTARRV